MSPDRGTRQSSEGSGLGYDVDDNIPLQETIYHRQASEPPHYSSNSSSERLINVDERHKQTESDGKVAMLAKGLSRQFSIESLSSLRQNNDFHIEPGSNLDPQSPTFSPRAWVKALLSLHSRDPERFPKRTAGVAFRNLNVFGYGADTDYQRTVQTGLHDVVGWVKSVLGIGQRKIQILHDFDGVVHSGEMLVLLGSPGSGCSTLLKTLAGETHGYIINSDVYLNYQGISAKQMHSDFRGEAIYTAETDVHFPMMTVGDTLTFAAAARQHRHVPGGIDRDMFTRHVRDIVMAVFGISHTVNTKVGNDYVRGISGGERKRVSIAEAVLSGAPLQCWDNSTRGLDSANAVEFCRSLRLETELLGATACVAIYQAPQSAFDVSRPLTPSPASLLSIKILPPTLNPQKLFDKVTLLYKGRQIYFGPTSAAKQYFLDLGFTCPDRQTTPDFLTSLTSPSERLIRPGFENTVPHTPDEFAAAWKNSDAYKSLLREIEQYDKTYPIGGDHLTRFIASRRAQQSRYQTVNSPYTLSYWGQTKLCVWRGFVRLRADPSLPLTALAGNMFVALVVGSVYYGLPAETGSFYERGSLLFFVALMAAFSSILEIITLYAQRPIVEKHTRYALYHPSCEALASMLTDLPYKLLNSLTFNVPIYLLANLRRTPQAFLFFWLTTFVITLTMSMLFRTIGAASRSQVQADAPSAVLMLALVMYTGFTIPVKDMLGWAKWLVKISPISYGFESLIINEFEGREFPCTTMLPMGPFYSDLPAVNRACVAAGAMPGSTTVKGDDFMRVAYAYELGRKWRNVGVVVGFMVLFLVTYLLASEYIVAKKSKGEVLLFRRERQPTKKRDDDDDDDTHGKTETDIESKGARLVSLSRPNTTPRPSTHPSIHPHTSVFHWQDVTYTLPASPSPKQILTSVSGWVKPSTLTALMGVSGAGKTTLLDVLASRITTGVVTGDIRVDGQERDQAFARKAGYVQQGDMHLATATVREALVFSAMLRGRGSGRERREYVEAVIGMLGMEGWTEAVVGVPGEGLNVEQRKRLTIGVELAARPELLLFLDEPTSGLDSQTSWSILSLLRTLAQNGQAILCTIHQPSAILFQRFDRLLLLAEGGKTVYFGDIGPDCMALIEYFERNGASPCPRGANPAEWMLEVIGATPGSTTEVDWCAVWESSPEYAEVREELAYMKTNASQFSLPAPNTSPTDTKIPKHAQEFAAPFHTQLSQTLLRIFQQYYRTPSYIYSKLLLGIGSGLFIGFSFFNAPHTQQGLQNQMYSIFMLMTIFGNLCQQLMPLFVTQRALYEARERPSKTYSWQAFMLSHIIVEVPWNLLLAAVMFCGWYYPIGMDRNAAEGEVVERSGLMFLYIWQFLMFTSTYGIMFIAGVEMPETAGNMANVGYAMCLIFCGVLASPTTLPRLWKWMYHLSPFTYLVSGLLSTGLSNVTMTCSPSEILTFDPPTLPNTTAPLSCGQYISFFQAVAGGYMENPGDVEKCHFCPLSNTDVFLDMFGMKYADRWRNFAVVWAFVGVNVAMALVVYWAVRVPKTGRGWWRRETA
ncbi:ABC transporter protein [Fimicolochytrium jonesii]|uniref:ABC transporter protein n=1 Tax=Fimicolochytrium jonesii TaxID=1396493 RepID=UPI0022FEE962|nr:ABC transporter protein [Fimicolochytrium jonesii]KAI8826583.1 ABC transporter protein [Fimicolochytrium jonesii]